MQAWVANNRSTRLQAFILHVVQQRFKAAGLRCRAPGFWVHGSGYEAVGFRGSHADNPGCWGFTTRVGIWCSPGLSSEGMQGGPGLQDFQSTVWDLGLKTWGGDVTVHPNGCGLWREATEYYRGVMNVPCPSRADHP